MQKIGAVLNSESGILSPVQKSERLKKLKDELSGKTAPRCLSVISGKGIGREVNRMVREEKVDILVAGGGDGTISTAADIVAGSDTVLLILPIGTKNNFAADLNLPSDPIEIIRTLDHAPLVQKVDTGTVNGRVFINNATIGVYPKLVEEREQKVKKRGWNKWRAKAAAFFNVLRRFPLVRVTVQAENFNAKIYTPFLFVGNNEYEEIPGKSYSRRNLDQGKLWLCMLRSPRIWSVYTLAFEVSLRNVREAENLDIRLLEEVTVVPRRNTVAVAVDGENMQMKSPLQFRIRKKNLRVITG